MDRKEFIELQIGALEARLHHIEYHNLSERKKNGYLRKSNFWKIPHGLQAELNYWKSQ